MVVPAAARGVGSPTAVPPERKFPVPVVIAHGLLAAATIIMVLLTALTPGADGQGRSAAGPPAPATAPSRNWGGQG